MILAQLEIEIENKSSYNKGFASGGAQVRDHQFEEEHERGIRGSLVYFDRFARRVFGYFRSSS